MTEKDYEGVCPCIIPKKNKEKAEKQKSVKDKR